MVTWFQIAPLGRPGNGVGRAGLSLLLSFLLFCLSSPASGAGGLPALTALAASGAGVSGLVVDLERGTVVAEVNPDQPLIPASIVKLYVTALSLEVFGPARVFPTELWQRGERQGDDIAGDLVLRGSGDPALTTAELWRLARSLRLMGVRRVTGNLVINESHFRGPVPCNTTDRCRAATRSLNSYDAPLSAVAVNFSNAGVLIVPDEVGQPAKVTPDPFDTYSITTRGEVMTVEKGGALEVERVTEKGINVFKLAGSIDAASPPLRIYRSIANPAHYTGELFAALLRQNGVTVKGRIRLERQPLRGEDRLLISEPGRTLAESLDLMLSYSNNAMADTLALDLLRALAPDREVTVAEAGRLLTSYGLQLAADSQFRGEIASSLALFDGSGLDPNDRATARDLIALLSYLYGRHADLPSFLGALVVPLHSVSRSLKSSDLDWQQRLAVKSGNLGEPVSVNTLAGFLRFRDGGWGAFAFLINGPEGVLLKRPETFEAIRSDLAGLWDRP